MQFKEIFGKLKYFKWKVFIALCLAALVPAVYQTIRTFLISSTVSTQAFDIIGQMEWFDLINETLLAFLVVPLYSILNKKYKEDSNQFSGTVFKTLLVSFCLYFLFSLIVFFYGIHLISMMNPNEINLGQVNTYFQLETIAFMIGIIGSFVNVVLVVTCKSKMMYILLVVQCVLLVLSDFVLIPNFGVNGVAFSNISVNLLMALSGLILLYFQKCLRPCKFCRSDFEIAKLWGKTGLFTGTQQFLDNFIYAVMVCKMVNMVAEQGNYWNANNFIWGWLLIPITALAEIIKTDCKEDYRNLKQSNYYLIVLFTVLLWLITIPLWSVYYQYCNKLELYNEVFFITLKLFPFYIAYGLCMIPDSIFIGYGNTKYTAINSAIINIGYYGIFYLLFKTNVIQMNMNVIILMFGFGMVVHLVVSLVEEKIFFKREILKKSIESLSL